MRQELKEGIVKMRKQRIFLIFITCLISLLVGFGACAQDSRPRLGLSVSVLQASPLLLQHLRLSDGEGLMVSNIVVGGELEAAGLSQGDIVLAIDGHALSKPSDLQDYVSSLPKGTQVTLDVIQKGEHRQIFLKLDGLPDEIVWKYAQPVSGPGRAGLGSRLAVPGQIPKSSSPQPQGSKGISSSRHSTFQTIVATPDGMKRSTVEISGDPDDPNSEIEITIDSDTYKSKIGDIEQLPEIPRNVAKNALAQSGQFSFSFGFGGGLFDEMMKRHEEQIKMMDEIFNRQFMGPQGPQINGEPEEENNGVLRPVEPDKNDIRS